MTSRGSIAAMSGLVIVTSTHGEKRVIADGNPSH